MTDNPSNRPVTMPAIITFLFLCPVVIGVSVLGPYLIDIPQPIPPALSLTHLPLPDVMITPGPAVTPDFDDDETYFSRELNAEVEIYINRFDLQWFPDEPLIFVRRISNGQYDDRLPVLLFQRGDIEGRLWRYDVVFPWPPEPFSGQMVYRIDGTTGMFGPGNLDPGARGPAGAEFVELHPNPHEVDPSDEVALARCRHHVHGQVTLTSILPVIGNFQFFCQFDSTDYAQVSGRFWE
jgi:hypothetical protein